MSDSSIVRFRAVLAAGLAALEEERERVNALNADSEAGGDTGDNMVLTLRAVLQELDRLAGAFEGRTIDEIGRSEIVASVARAALLAARGTSGVILSQLIRGAAEELASRPGELVDPVLIAAALGRAVDQAYGSVRAPAEGTILTVARELAHRVASALAHMPEPRLAPGASASEQDAAIAAVVERALAVGDPVPRSAVTDAGGYGLMVLMSGMVAALRGARAPQAAGAPALRPREHVSGTYRYCTSFAVIGPRLVGRQLTAALERLGDSVLVGGDAETLRVHVHTDDPDAVTALFSDHGTISRLDVVDMRAGAPTP